MSQGSVAPDPASAAVDPELPPEGEPSLEPEPLLDALPDELPPELFWAPELEPVPDAVASPDPPSSPAGIELPDELPAPVETPLVDDDPHAAIDDGTHANPRRIQTRQFTEGETSRLAEALVS